MRPRSAPKRSAIGMIGWRIRPKKLISGPERRSRWSEEQEPGVGAGVTAGLSVSHGTNTTAYTAARLLALGRFRSSAYHGISVLRSIISCAKW
jgi:hypothetical protein